MLTLVKSWIIEEYDKVKINSRVPCCVLVIALLVFSGLRLYANAEEPPAQPAVAVEGQGAVSGLHRIEASAGPHGRISPSGAVAVRDGSEQIFAIVPDSGFYVADVLVDGSPAGAVKSYKFSGVTGDHTISAAFLPCAYSLAPKKQDVGAAGGTFSLDITASDGSCAWSAGSDDPVWIATSSSGRGSGSVGYAVQANAGPARTGFITVGGRRFAIEQASGCTYKTDRSSEKVGAHGGSYGFRVTSSESGCAWTISSDNPSWIAVAGSGAGAGTANFTVSENTGPARAGSLSAGGQVIRVYQESGCSFELSPSGEGLDPKAGNYSFAIKASDSGCAWKAASNNPSWISTSAAGTGSGTVNYTVRGNTGPERSSSISVGGQTFSVSQGNGCIYKFDPAGLDAPVEGGFYGFAVSASDSSCAWTARSGSPLWLTSSSSGTADGTVSFSVSSNAGPARTGSIFIGGHAFAVRQPSGCRYSVTPAGDSIASTGGEFSFSVSATDEGCPWSAKSNDPAWIATTSSGSGSGTVRYAVAANPGLTRIGSLTAGGQNFVISQGNGCRYRLEKTVSDVGPATESYTVGVLTSDSACPWTAQSNDPSWIETADSGAGDGTVRYTVQAHEGPERTGSLTAGGQSLTVKQASGCLYRLSKTALSIGPSTGSYSISVSSSDDACPWTAVSKNSSWLTSSSSGTGHGPVTFSVQQNPGPERTGSVSVGGQAFTVTQGDGCNFMLNPVGDRVSPYEGEHTFNIVASAPDCPWTAKSDTPAWVATQSSGSGDGTITYTVASNREAARKGTVSAGGQKFSVYQASGINYHLTVSKSGSGTGTVSSLETPDPSISCGGRCPSSRAAYIDGTVVRLKAAPDESSSFNGWSGSCSGAGECSVKVDSDKSVSAAFIKKVRMVHAHAGPGGSISPFTQAARHGDTMQFMVTPNNGYHIRAVSGCGITHHRSSSIGEGGKGEKAGFDLRATEVYITSPITADCSVTAEFAPESFTVTPSASGHGSISAATPQIVGYGGSAHFTVKADPEYHIESVSGCGGNDYLDDGKSKTGRKMKALTEYSYTTGKITHHCTVAAKFAVDTYTVTPKAEKHGSLEPSSPQQVNRLDMISFTINPDPGYHLASVSGCGGEFISEDEYVTGYITADCTVNASFKLDVYTVTVKLSGAGTGTVSAGGLSCEGHFCRGTFEHGKKVVLRIRPAAGSKVADVKVDGSSIGSQKTVVISEVKGDSNIEVLFAPALKR